MFPTIDYSARVSHFDPRSEYKDFRGFFVLFWVGLAIMVITTMLRNIKDTGYPLRVHVWSLLTENVKQLFFADLAMVASTSLSLPLHKAFRSSKGWLRWEKGGMAIQSMFQAAWLVFWIKSVAGDLFMRWSSLQRQFAFLTTLDVDGSGLLYSSHFSLLNEDALLCLLQRPSQRDRESPVCSRRSEECIDRSGRSLSQLDHKSSGHGIGC